MRNVKTRFGDHARSKRWVAGRDERTCHGAERVMPTGTMARVRSAHDAVGPFALPLSHRRDASVLSFGRGSAPEPAAGLSCRQCGRRPSRPDAAVCGRCGIPFGSAPRADVALPICPICYATVADDGLLPSLAEAGRHVPIAEHIVEHERHPVGDDEWLETLRAGDRIRIGRWEAPFDVVRRYLVTGVVDAGRRRAMLHDAIVSAMGQVARWGDDASSSMIGDQPEWREARAAVSALLERYHRR